MFVTRAAEEDVSDVEEMDTSETQWHWFYLADCGVWHMFEVGSNTPCTVTSDDIEKNYSRNQQGVMEFSTAKYTYRLDFSVMKQTNTSTGKQRPIKRALFSVTGFRFICDNLALPVPSHWEMINTDDPYQLIPLHGNTYEYKEVLRLFERTLLARIKAIKRIQNLDLWEFFCRKKAQLRKIKRVPDIEERMLFHGTSHDIVQAICTHNFDWRLNGSHGNVYGKGTYFARDAKYSSKFCHNGVNHHMTLQTHGVAPLIFQSEPSFKSMFLARVLVGDFTLGNSTYCRPPSKDRSLMNFYDSCVDDIANPKIFVIFDCNQIYPEYLIEFF
ncbi:protein mono-ADP-ribosyltransferase PARP11 [Amia ocellicauda]|uniref:protein mono-ADP-ribosyltransferase PARP11 n=1 Tax=Amia ocellicauda TaxID=2972642 RepID=UPI0034649067